MNFKEVNKSYTSILNDKEAIFIKFTVNDKNIVTFSEEKRLKQMAKELSKKLKKINIQNINLIFLECLRNFADLLKNEQKIIEYDFKNITLENKHKNMMCYYHYLVYYVGEVCSLLIFNNINMIPNKIYETNGIDVVNLSEMNIRGLEYLLVDLQEHKKDFNHSFGSSLIFQTLFERNIFLCIRRMAGDNLIKNFSMFIKNNNIILSMSENDLYVQYLNSVKNILGEKRDRIEFCVLQNGKSIDENMCELYEKYKFFCTYSKSKTNDIKKILLDRKLTLGTLLRIDYVNNHIKDEVMFILDILYSSNKLNLRNNLAHCNLEYYNCYDPKIASILFCMNCLIISNQAFKIDKILF